MPGDATPEIATVYTAEQLQRAFHAGVRDIEIRAHLDLRGLPLWDDPISTKFSGSYQFGVVGRSTRSIRVCSCPLDGVSHVYNLKSE